MKIWIDGYEANVAQRLGSGQVAFELLKNIEKLDKENDYTVLLPSEPRDDLPKEREGFKYQIIRPSKLWTRFALPLHLFRSSQKPDLIFSPTHYIPQFTSLKRIVTVFDTGYFHFPETLPRADLWKLKNWTKYSVKNAEHIITISEAAKKDIIKFYKIDEDKITVAYPGHSLSFKPVNDKAKVEKIKNQYKIQGNYIIYIGTIQPRKNLVRLIEAMKDIQDLKLVLVGKTKGLGRQGWKYQEILATPSKLGIENKVIFTGFVPDEELVYLLSGASAFVFPSLWEGFGIPVVDAMACGKPVIVSNVASLPEIVGDAGVLVDPNSVDSIKDGILKLVNDKALMQRLSHKSMDRAALFSWEKMARQVLDVFRQTQK